MAIINGTAGRDILTGTDGPDTINGLGGDDSLSGGLGDDILFGGAGSDVLRGGAGADRLDGGGDGLEFASYEFSPAAVTIDLTLGTGVGGDAQGDVITNIPNIKASNFDDRVIGNSEGNTIEGISGNDTIYGLGGGDSLNGGAGNDVLIGGAGHDFLDGGSGIDWVYYNASPSGITLDLNYSHAQGAIGHGGEADGDLVRGVENIYGSAHNDTLTGNGVTNVLLGNTGTDTLTGGAAGDYFVYRDVTDSTIGPAGRDIITDFSHAQSDKIDLRPIDADGNGANGNTAFTFTTGGAFTGSGHEVIVLPAGGGVYTVLADIDGDKVADMAINVHSVIALVAGDFLL